MRKIVSIMFVFMSFFFFISNVNAQSFQEEPNDPSTYITYLESLPEKSKVVLNDKSENEIQTFINQFNSLSSDKQQKLVDYLRNPEFIKEISEAQYLDTTDKNVSLFNGDVAVSSTVLYINDSSESQQEIVAKAVGDSYFKYAKHTATTTVFGLDIVKTSAYIQVEIKQVAPNTSKIVKILEGGGIVEQNYMPGLDISKSVNPAFLTSDGTIATQKVIWGWNFVKSGLGLVVGNREQWVQINKAGVSTGGAANL
ncbi:hypothetical protein [Paenibacillus campi]|uniref:hypothetical protein n=1 Tax=Paenibacillus campi TaxID=3106031 RepID=UPI002AFF19C5|nr:hypothetical protein [Paenibacillus sp. SGZ-1009]